jgi:predicted O-methyltransferase YrrM
MTAADSDYRMVAPLVEHLDGWMRPEQGARLFEAARRCREGGTIVEIGSFRAKSLIVLASGAPLAGSVFAIDPHAGNDRGPGEISGYGQEAQEDNRVFWANLEHGGVADRVTHIRKFSDQAHGEVPGLIDVLYVDGAHRYGPARADIRDWGARVRDGGTLLIHDSFSSVGVTLAIGRELVWGRRFRFVGRSSSLAEYRADLGSGVRARGRNAAQQLLMLPWFARNVLIKVLLSLGAGKLLERLGRTAPEWPY